MTDRDFGAARLISSIFGMLAGVGGPVHGFGEILQGNVRPEGIIVNSWAVGPIATNMGGEPGMTIVPSFLITGILTVLVSLAIVVWSAAFMRDRTAGRILLLLSVIMLLVGGGFGPPIIGILAGVAGTGIGRPSPWWSSRLSKGMWRSLVALWPWIFGIAAINGVFLVIGSLVLVYLFDLNMPELFVMSFFFAVLSLFLTLVVGRGYDVQGRRNGALAPA